MADARFMKPLDVELIRRLAREHDAMLTVEENAVGGFGAHVLHFMVLDGLMDDVSWSSFCRDMHVLCKNMVITHTSQTGRQPGVVVKPARGQWNREKKNSLPSFGCVSAYFPFKAWSTSNDIAVYYYELFSCYYGHYF